MKKALGVVGLVALLWAVAIASSQFQRGMDSTLKTKRVTAGAIPAVAVDQDGEIRVVPVQADGTLPEGGSELDFYLTDEQIVEANGSTKQSLWLDSLETHNSRRGRTYKLTLRSPAGVTVSIYEGSKGKVIPQQSVAVPNEALTSVAFRALGRGAAAGFIAFVVLGVAAGRFQKRQS